MKTTNSEMLECGHPESPHSDITRGYGVDKDGKRHCYACCAESDKRSIVAGESIVLYFDFPAERKNTDRTYRHAFKPRLHSNVGIIGKEDLAVVTNWPGTVLGHIIAASVHRHNFGGRFVSIRARMFDGSVYIGRASYDNGSCINMRKAAR